MFLTHQSQPLFCFLLFHLFFCIFFSPLNVTYNTNIDRKVEMVSFELGEELRKMFFRLVTSVGQRKNSESPRGIEPQTFGFALRYSTTEPQRLFGDACH